MERTVSILGESFSKGWRSFLENFLVCLLNALIFVLLATVISCTVVGVIFVPALYAGFLHSMLRICEGEKVKVGEIFTQMRRFHKFLGASVLLFFGIVGGLCLFIVPGLYLIVRWSFVTPILIKDDCEVLEAFNRSKLLTKDYMGEVFGLRFILFAISSLSSLISFGFVLLTPLVNLIYTHYFLSLRKVKLGEKIEILPKGNS